MRFASHAALSASVLGLTVSAASAPRRPSTAPFARGVSSLTARYNPWFASNEFDDDCMDVCMPIWRKFEVCGDGAECFCAGSNGEEFLTCFSCRKDPGLSSFDARQRGLDEFSEACGNPAGTLQLTRPDEDPQPGDIPAPSKESKTPTNQNSGQEMQPDSIHRLIILPDDDTKIRVDQREGQSQPSDSDIEEALERRGGAFVYSFPIWKNEFIKDLSEFQVPSQQQRRGLNARQDRREDAEWEVLEDLNQGGIRGVHFGIHGTGVGGDLSALHWTNSNTLREEFTDEITIHFDGTAMSLFSTLNCTSECEFSYTVDGGDSQTITLDATGGSVDTLPVLELTNLANARHSVELKDFNAFNSLAINHALVTPGDRPQFEGGRVFVDRDDPSAVFNGWPGSLDGSEVGQSVSFAFSGGVLWALGRWITDAPSFESSLSIELHNTGEVFTFPLHHFEGVVQPRAPFFMPFAIRQAGWDEPNREKKLELKNVTVSVVDGAIPSGSFELTGLVYQVSTDELYGEDPEESSAEGAMSPSIRAMAGVVAGFILMCL